MISSLYCILFFTGRVLLYAMFFFNMKEYNLNTLLCFISLFGMDLVSNVVGYNKGWDDGCKFGRGEK